MAQANSVHAFKANMGKMKKEKGSTDKKIDSYEMILLTLRSISAL